VLFSFSGGGQVYSEMGCTWPSRKWAPT